MNLNEAKQAAYSAANRSASYAKQLFTVPDADAPELAAQLERCARELNCAALEITARLKGVPEPKITR